MRSEKEIRKVLEAHSFYADKGDIQYFRNYKALLEWVLEGEPRYSIAELEKIINLEKQMIETPSGDCYDMIDPEGFIEFLKNQEVQKGFVEFLKNSGNKKIKKGRQKTMREGKFEVWKSISNQWFFHLVAPNGKIIAQSDEYSSNDCVLNGIAAVKRYAEKAEVIEG